MNMREAVLKTRDLHQMVVDGKYPSYMTACEMNSMTDCYLCEAARRCMRCPHEVIDNRRCVGLYDDSPEAIKRLDRWLADPRLEEL